MKRQRAKLSEFKFTIEVSELEYTIEKSASFFLYYLFFLYKLKIESHWFSVVFLNDKSMVLWWFNTAPLP